MLEDRIQDNRYGVNSDSTPSIVSVYMTLYVEVFLAWMINCKVMTDTNSGHVRVGGGAINNVLDILCIGLDCMQNLGTLEKQYSR